MKRLHPALVLLVVAILAYGLLLRQLGFYWDDLPMSWVRYQLGPEAMTQYFSTNRPIWGLLYQVTTRLLPQIPIYWQTFALLSRWLGAVLWWAILRRLWPHNPSAALSASLLFLLYPGFNQQWVSYLYSHFFIVVVFYLSSLYLMLRRGILTTLLAILLAALNLWMLEYFFVLELARPFILWAFLRGEALEARARLTRTIRRWLPYLGVFLLAVLSRLFIFNNQIYGFSIREQFTNEPVIAVLGLFGNILGSLWTATAAAWTQVFHFPAPAVDGPRVTALYALVALLVLFRAILSFWQPWTDAPEAGRRDTKGMIGLGMILFLLGGPPFWLTGVPVSLGFPASRALLSFAPGVSLILAGLIQLIPSAAWRTGVMALSLALAAGRQFLWSNDFRLDWAAHREFFWQMTWRAPGLSPNTIVMTNQELEFYADNSMGAALNWIYAPDYHTNHVDYVLFYPPNRLGGSLPSLKPGLPVYYSYLAGEFEGSTSRTVALYYDPPGCLRVLDPDLDPQNQSIPVDSLMREAAALSSTLPILPTATARMPRVYSPEPPHGWCYYFEQADLARQRGDWKTVVALGDKALALEDYPNDPVERFVFIEGYAHAGAWDYARDLTLSSYRISKNVMGPLLCRLWDRIDRQTATSARKQTAVEEIKMKIACYA